MKVRLLEGMQNRIYSAVRFFNMRHPPPAPTQPHQLRAAGKSFVDQCAPVPLNSLCAQQTWAPGRSPAFLGPLAPPPGKIWKCASAREKSGLSPEGCEGGAFATSSGLSGNCTQSCECLKSVSVSLRQVRLFETSWAVAHQAPLSTGLSRQEYWSGLPFPSPGNLPDPGIQLGSPVLQADSLL